MSPTYRGCFVCLRAFPCLDYKERISRKYFRQCATFPLHPRYRVFYKKSIAKCLSFCYNS